MATSLENQYIQDSYQKVVQISGSVIADGTGSVITDLDLTASHAVSASYAVSASVEIIKEVSSSYADFAQQAGFATSSLSSSYAVSASHAENSGDWNGQFDGNAGITGSLTVNDDLTVEGTDPKITLNSATHTGSLQEDRFLFTNNNTGLVTNQFSANAYLLGSQSRSIFGISDAFVTLTSTQTGLSSVIDTEWGLKFKTAGVGPTSNMLVVDSSTGLMNTQLALSSSNSISASAFKGDGTDITGVVSASYAVTASHLTGNVISASYAENATSASHAVQADTSISSSHAVNSDSSISASYSLTASYAETSEPQVSSSYAVSSSHAEKADSADSSTTSISASHAVQADSSLTATSASHALASDTSISSSHAVQADNSISSSYAITASYAENSAPQVSASYAVSSSYSVTASYAEQATSAADANDLIIGVKNTLGVTINKGETLHATGVTGENIDVITASNANGDMPAIGLALENINAGAAGNAIISGRLIGFNTNGFVAGTNVYVGVDGGLTSTKPTGSALIQNIGIVGKVDAADGELVVLGAGRSNDVPNITEDYVWKGDSNGVAQAVASSSLIVDNANTASYVDFDNIDNKPTLLSSSAQIADDISGSFTSTSASIASDIATNTSNITSLTTVTGSYATTGSNVFSGGQTITGSLNQTGGNVDINASGLLSLNSAGAITMEAAGFGITGDMNQFGFLTSNFDAPGTNQQKAFFNVASSSIGSLDYNRVFYGMADFPGFGRFYEDYFAIEYYDSLGYNFGSELSVNGQAVGFNQRPSGSSAAGRSELKLKDNLNSSGTLDMLSDNITGVGRSLVQFSNTSGNVVQLDGTNFNLIAQGGSGTVFVNGSVEVNKVMQLNEQNPLPGGETGQLAVSASNLYYHNGTAWSQIN